MKKYETKLGTDGIYLNDGRLIGRIKDDVLRAAAVSGMNKSRDGYHREAPDVYYETEFVAQVFDLKSKLANQTDELEILRGQAVGWDNWAKYGKVVPGHVVFDDLGQANTKIEALELIVKELRDRLEEFEQEQGFGRGLGEADQKWLIDYLNQTGDL